LPSSNFGRILLILFIMFSMIIRTVHQGELYSNLQSDLRKPEIQTIAELLEKNFTIYGPSNNMDLIRDNLAFLSNATRVAIKVSSIDEILDQIAEPSFKGTMIVTENTLLSINAANYASGTTSIKLLKEPIMKMVFGIMLPVKHPIVETFNLKILQLNSAGLIQYWIARNLGNRDEPEPESEPEVLTLEHLAIGFKIHTFFLIISAIAFVLERIVYRTRKAIEVAAFVYVLKKFLNQPQL